MYRGYGLGAAMRLFFVSSGPSPPHLEKMYAFWSSVMLTSGRYKGNPVYTHRKVAGIQPTMFGSWLDLFEATSAELLSPRLPIGSRAPRGASAKA